MARFSECAISNWLPHTPVQIFFRLVLVHKTVWCSLSPSSLGSDFPYNSNIYPFSRFSSDLSASPLIWPIVKAGTKAGIEVVDSKIFVKGYLNSQNLGMYLNLIEF